MALLLPLALKLTCCGALEQRIAGTGPLLRALGGLATGKGTALTLPVQHSFCMPLF